MKFKRLMIMRHATAAPPQLHAHDEVLAQQLDWERPLNDKGIHQCLLVAKKIRELGWIPEWALISDSLRTKQTWENVSSQWPQQVVHQFTHELYCASGETHRFFLEFQRKKIALDVSTLMILAHNPGVGDFAGLLLKNENIVMPTASAILLKTEANHWDDVKFTSEGQWTFEHFLK